MAIQKHHVSTNLIKENSQKELSDTFYHVCSFCEKLVKISSPNFKSCKNLGGQKYYCSFCLRNNLNYKSNKNVLIMSYRAIFGDYYYQMYFNKKNIKLWFSEIEQLIEDHEKQGLVFPMLSYDPLTYLWFVDFNKIGNNSRKAPFEETKYAVREILECLQITEIHNNFILESIWNKFDKAIDLFYKKRQRPKNRRMLIPTLHNKSCQLINCDKTRNFLPHMFKLK